MEALRPNLQELQFCMKDPRCIRNVCILAHVDHGKTTVADLLLATNRLIGKRLAGFLRYLDDRPDEQQRGITMKSSTVSLLNVIYDDDTHKNRTVLLNLIDTPGHIDFSSEVGAALRVCDGAIILVDVVEGVCVQTRESISKAFEEQAKMILVINKLDKLITELEKNSNEIFQCILRVIEDCNAFIAELYQYAYLDNDIDIEDTGLLFSPHSGNIIFASAVDGWGFTTKQIAKMFINLVRNETVDTLNEKLWNFDLYIDSKGDIRSGAIDKKKSSLFEQFCIKPIEHLYQTIVIRSEKDKIPKFLEKLGISNPSRDMLHNNDSKTQIREILSHWKPLAVTLLLQCIRIIPSPHQIDKNKAIYLLNLNRYIEDPYISNCIQSIFPYFENLPTEANVPVVAYVSKMFCVNKKNLSQHAPKQFLPKPRNALQPTAEIMKTTTSATEILDEEGAFTDDIAVIGLTRVFTGTLTIGQQIFCLTAGYLPKEELLYNVDELISKNKCISLTTIKELYMLIGRDLVFVESVPAGNICGIGEHPSPPPVVTHAVEPVNPKDLPILRNGLKYLMQSDSCVQVMVQESGQMVIQTAGDVHLDKCIEDLTSKFAKIKIQVSSPMVSLRETVIGQLNENMEEISVITSNARMSMYIVSLPPIIVETLKNNHEFLTMIEEHQSGSLIDIIRKFNASSNEKTVKQKTFKNDVTNRSLKFVQDQLKSAFSSCEIPWRQLTEKIWSVGKDKDCVNLLINDIDDYTQNIFLEANICDKRTLLANCIINQFHSFCKAGPLCEESLTNCAFITKSFELLKDILPEEITPQLVSSEESALRGLMKNCFDKQEQRLMEPIYTTSIQVTTAVLGKVYSVISRRHGKVLEAVGMDEKEKSFTVQAQIPVIESEGFANEIRSTTSGQANPSLRFSHYEIIDGDPFYEATDELDDEDEINVESALRASRLRKEVRRRKGLQVEDEVVVHAEKQRTLNKKK
ncbi:elongation factor-like GTPase 1 isoform X2 [Cylas formicarius]|uniref:elongation factor-like GTPase 1 isoform X2 n=1 Tax=Cylas formicarius TaxID=197179 RepID=UPI0029585877|nr:elongation factor-like GTPase 1 isoform X2 [Cylas formicarius]